jgi:dynamin-like GTPase MGM1, mitochondrial
MERFAREDPKIRQHIDLVRRKELLEHALKEMESLRQLEGRERGGRGGRREASERGSAKGWGFF